MIILFTYLKKNQLILINLKHDTNFLRRSLFECPLLNFFYEIKYENITSIRRNIKKKY